MSRCVCRRNAGRRERGGGEEGEGGVVGGTIFLGGQQRWGLAMVGATMHSFECRPRVGWARGEGNVVGAF